MSLNDTPSSERTRIGFFGLRNAGKSSLVNAVCAQEVSVVSRISGTTTDPVRKSMELLPLGPVVIVDTPGIDDAGELGKRRVERARAELENCDIAVLVVDATRGWSPADRALAALVETCKVVRLTVWSKADLLDGETRRRLAGEPGALLVSARDGSGVDELKERLARLVRPQPSRPVVADLVGTGELVILVIPIDGSAPKGRLILPQQLVLRELLEAHAVGVCTRPEEFSATMGRLGERPRLVICDSQVFAEVARAVPRDVTLTSFSILMARHKGELAAYARGAKRLARLAGSSRVLISEGCTHHRQCQDIGTVKLPLWIEGYIGARPHFEFTSGAEFPHDPSGFDLVVHCGACMLNQGEMARRIRACEGAGVPIINYGLAIAQMRGILARSLEAFPGVGALFQAEGEGGDTS